jgi:hypothetical protein
MLICLCIDYSVFHGVTVQLGSCDRDCLTCKAQNIYYFVLLRKSLMSHIESVWKYDLHSLMSSFKSLNHQQ